MPAVNPATEAVQRAGPPPATSAPTNLPARLALCCALLLLAIPAALIAQTIQCRTNYYKVTGSTEREIRDSMNRVRRAAGTGEHDAFTRWKVDCTFTTRATPTGHRLNTFNSRTTILVTLPRWPAPGNADASLRNEWDRFVKALGDHEAGHVQCARAAASEVHRRVKDIGETSDNEALSAQINATVAAVISEYREHEKAFDQRTQHGAAQGATFPWRKEE